jgi:hypothetical protein
LPAVNQFAERIAHVRRSGGASVTARLRRILSLGDVALDSLRGLCRVGNGDLVAVADLDAALFAGVCVPSPESLVGEAARLLAPLQARTLTPPAKV